MRERDFKGAEWADVCPEVVAWRMDPSEWPPKVWVVILNWNGLADTLECLRSLKRQGYKHTQVVVIDNGSQSREADEIEASNLADSVLRRSKNIGFAAGSNEGIRHALEQGADYVWLLNNDTRVEPDCLTTLVRTGEAEGRVGLLSPVIYDHASPHPVKFTGTIVDFDRQDRTHLTSTEDMARAAHADDLALWGTALLIKRRVVEQVGLLDERYFAYVEDMDYSIRAVNAGFATRVVRRAAVYHKEGRALGGLQSPAREYLMARNSYLFWRTHLRGRQRWGFRARYVSWVLDRALAAHLMPMVADESLHGAWDALRGRWGSWEQSRAMPTALKAFVQRWVLGWHPYFWIRLLAGDVRGLSSEAVRRVFRRRARPR